MKIAREGMGLALALALAGVLGFFLGWRTLGVLCGVAAFAVVGFFRDPERFPPADPDAVVSPADGRVTVCERLADGSHHIVVFLAVWNVHINRAPYGGTVKDIRHTKGKFLAAFNPAAGIENERNRIVFTTPRGDIAVTQVAGLIARRIVCYLSPGGAVERGARIGLIQFGSRVDCELPPGAVPSVRVGEHVKGAETVIAKFTNKEA